MASALTEILDSTRREERRRALRGLLNHPVLFGAPPLATETRDGRSAKPVDEHFILVRRHADYLGRWFARYTGWTLIVRADSARLIKRPVESSDATRPAINPGSTGGSLTRPRYVLWCLLLMVLHDEGRQTTLKRLAEQTTRTATTIVELQQNGCDYDLKSAPTRRGLVCVIRLAVKYGILQRIGGHEDRYGQNETVDCLYNIHPGLLTDLLSLPPDWSTQSLLAPVGNEEADEIRPREFEHRLMRRLLDDPILYFDHLTEHEYQYFQSQRSRMFDVLESAVGLVPELRAEGVAMLDPIGDLTDVKMPDSGTIGHATLLIAEFLGQHENPEQGCSRETLLSHLATLASRYKRFWKKGITEMAQQTVLLDQCVERLEMLNLIRCGASGAIVPMPAIARFATDEIELNALAETSNV